MMANNPNRNKLRREFERETAMWNALTEEQKQAQREVDELQRQLTMARHAGDMEGRAAWEALPKEDRDTWHRVNSVINKVKLAHHGAISRAQRAVEAAEHKAKQLAAKKEK
jgi:hypothetical protein